MNKKRIRITVPMSTYARRRFAAKMLRIAEKTGRIPNDV